MSLTRCLRFRQTGAAALAVSCLLFTACGSKGNEPPALSVTSTAFTSGTALPKDYTCEGTNIMPPLSFGSVPKDAKSLAILMDDLDAPKGIAVQAMIWNLSPAFTQIAGERSLTGAVIGLNSQGVKGYTGPCPLPGKAHRYVISVYALNSDLTFKTSPSRVQFKRAMLSRVLAKGELLTTYQR
ncbi:MAG: phospholipid-binding protein family [Candidatus Peribacteria bacterium]|nr:phospholipid-binding protein family [Candidatus Peribacteria bacterium]